MASFVNRNRNNLFKKRDYLNIVKWVVRYVSLYFGYRCEPRVFESVNTEGSLMCICGGYKKGKYAIFYDYMQWKREFGDLSFEEQAATVMYITAHEMRHYYQLRQLESKRPDEHEERLESWRKNMDNPRYVDSGCSVFDFFMQPMELDATLFAYVFLADMTDLLFNTDYIGESYIDELEKYYIELFGQTNEELFPNNQDAE